MAAIVEPLQAVQDAPSVCLSPWLENPYRLVSLWDLMKHAKIENIVATLRNIWISAGMVSLLGRDETRGRAALDVAEINLKQLDNLCRDLDLPMTRLHITDVVSAIQITRDGYKPSMLDVTERGCMVLCNNLEKEMSLKLYFTLPHDKATIYETTDFGAAVADAFRSAAYDISEACKCYALARNTACVFHLMRVMETGLGALAKQFNELYDHTNWETIISRVEKLLKEYDKMPNRPENWKDDREFYSQCVSHFRVVKDAWRNYTAHARGKYDEQEALDMLGNVRGFMQKLATRLHE
ncbi:MAG: hypothetical protein LAP38_01320 [Acidobacteriia bacterium]|nr:hypothetical protein [Terriglobia bacterium]